MCVLLFICSSFFFLLPLPLSSPTCEVRQDIDAGRPTPLALGLADQHQVVPGLVPAVVAVAAAAVLNGERRGYLFSVAADEFGQGPEFFLLLGGNPAFDEDEVGVLYGLGTC